jgi:hypothetical protein
MHTLGTVQGGKILICHFRQRDCRDVEMLLLD